MQYAPICTLLEMEHEWFKDDRRPSRTAVALSTRRSPNRIGLALVKLRGLGQRHEQVNSTAQLDRSVTRRAA